jgi:hypothetical protein
LNPQAAEATAPAPEEKVTAPDDKPLTTPAAEETVDVAVDDKPLAMPAKFKRSLAKAGVTRFSVVDGEGRLKIFNLDGTPVDLCGPKPKGQTGPRTCTLGGNAKELTLLMSTTSDCGHCSDAVGHRHSCYKPTSKYSCTTRDKNCASSCN